jgi:hypothetical protein
VGKRWELVALAIAVLSPLWLSSESAHAAANVCLSRAPRTVAEFQQVTEAQSPGFGIGDLTTMIDLPDGRRLYIFGDTSYHAVNADGSRGPIVGWGNNSAWLQSGRCFTLLRSANGDNRSWIQPPEQDGSVYWPGGATVVGNRLHVALGRLFLDGAFGTGVGAAIATFELPSLELARITPIPFSPSRVLGSGLVYDGGYLYAYGSHRKSCAFCFRGDVYLGRVREELVGVPSAWQFRAGGKWVSDINASKPLIPEAASQTNITRWGNGFLMVTKPNSIVGPEVDAWWAPAPAGPWQPLGHLYDVPVPPPSRVPGYTYQEAYSYMVSVLPSAHVDDGGVLLGYNVNSFEPQDGQIDGHMGGPRFVSVHIPDPPESPARAVSTPAPSPWNAIVATDNLGRVQTADGNVANASSYTRTAVGIAQTITGRGSWVVAADGGIFSTGDATFYGSMGGTRLNKPIVGIAATPTGRGYWTVASDGGVFSFGDAQFYGSTGHLALNMPVTGMTPTPTGRGYWLVALDGGIFAFGDARFFGSTGAMHLQYPVADIAATPSGRGYYLTTWSGAVYAFGDARHFGNAPWPSPSAIVGLSVVPGGYRMIDMQGRVFHRGASHGSTSVPNAGAPIVALAG